MTRPATPVTAPACPVCGRQPPLGFATFNGKRYCDPIASRPDSSCVGRTINAWKHGEPLPEEKIAAQQAKPDVCRDQLTIVGMAHPVFCAERKTQHAVHKVALRVAGGDVAEVRWTTDG